MPNDANNSGFIMLAECICDALPDSTMEMKPKAAAMESVVESMDVLIEPIPQDGDVGGTAK